MDAAVASFNTTVRQMNKMSQLNNPLAETKNSQQYVVLNTEMSRTLAFKFWVVTEYSVTSSRNAGSTHGSNVVMA